MIMGIHDFEIMKDERLKNVEILRLLSINKTPQSGIITRFLQTR